MSPRKRKSLTEKILEILETNPDEEYDVKYLMAVLSRRRVKTSPDVVKAILYRLYKRGLIERLRRGVYGAKTGKHIEQSWKEVKEIIGVKDEERFLIYNLKLIAEEDNLEKLRKKGYKLKLQANGKEIELSDLFNPFSPNSFFQKYNSYNSKRISNSFIEEYEIKHNPKRKIKLRLYDNGTIHIYITADEDPLELSELHEVILYLDAIFLSRFTYSFYDLMPLFFIERFKSSTDDRIISSEDLPQSLVFTLQLLEEHAYRQYQKKILDGEYLRKEHISHIKKKKTLPPDVEEFLHTLDTLI